LIPAISKGVNNMHARRVAVIGGAGFIGSHLVDKLIGIGCPVSVIDDLSTGKLANVNPGARFYHMKAESKILNNILMDDSISTLFFLAANSNVPLSVQDPLFDFKSLNCAINVIDQCRLNNVRQFIFTSSGFIYGNTKIRPIREEEHFKPISPYAISKNTIEQYLEFYHEVYGLSYTVLRLATVFGPRQASGALMDYIMKLANGGQAEFFGNGSKTRDYIYIDDVIEALIKSIDLPEVPFPVFNISSGTETTLLAIYGKIAEMLGRKPEPIIRPDRLGELHGYSLCNEKAKKILKWEPKTTIEEGLTKILRHQGLLT
jgi:UDP-glucose 4-epimerase